jgi:DNA recombination protein RmuC
MTRRGSLCFGIGYGWRQESIAENAKEISELGREVHKRVSDMASHWIKLGRNLSNSVAAYNLAVGSLEARVLVTARKFKELQAAPDHSEVERALPIEISIRPVQAPEFLIDQEAELISATPQNDELIVSLAEGQC